MSPTSQEVQRGDTISVALRLDTDEDECVNAVDGVVTYSSNIEPVDTSRGNSILSVWVEDPVIDKENRQITFAGGIPNGYCGRVAGDPRLTNTVIELMFRSPGMVVGAANDSNTASVSFAPETQVYLNDGFGTVAPLTTYGTTIDLTKTAGNRVANEWSERVAADTTPPEAFSIFLERSPNAFSNRHYIVFNTTDKQSGIDHYEVIEEPLSEQNYFSWGAETAPWVEARSPYVLKDQSLNSTIRVRAIDKAGNEYIASLVPDTSQRTLSTQGKIMIAVVATALIVFAAAAAFAWFWYRRRTRRTEDETFAEAEEEDWTEVDDEADNDDNNHEQQP